jgi:hypothetical protein
MKGMTGTILDARPIVHKERLRVVAKISLDELGSVDAFLPDREVAALAPRSRIVGNTRRTGYDVLQTVDVTLKPLVVGRPVRVWTYQDEFYCSFLPWRAVRIIESDESPETTGTAERRMPPKR